MKSAALKQFKDSWQYGFLHFHDKVGKRWADVKIKGEWKEVKIRP